jgi:hypothetical protein
MQAGATRWPTPRFLWFGTAVTPPRFYERFYDPDGGHVRVRAQQTDNPRCFIYLLRKAPRAFKVAILRAVHDASHAEAARQRKPAGSRRRASIDGANERAADKWRLGMMNSHSWNGIGFNSLVGGADPRRTK